MAVPRNFLSKTNTPTALNPPLQVERHILAERECFWSMSFDLNITAGRRAVVKRIVLKRALTATITDRAVEWVIDEQEFENALTVFVKCLGVGINHKAFR